MPNLKSPVALEQLRNHIMTRRPPEQITVSVCGGTGCHAYKCEDVAAALRQELACHPGGRDVVMKVTGCHGLCERGPLMVIHPQGIFYQRVKPGDVPEIVAETVFGGRFIDRLLYTGPGMDAAALREDDIPFYRKQQRLIFGNNGLIDPTSIEDYMAIGGYSSLAKALFAMKPADVIEEIKVSGLRGRGGAGFPTGLKWEMCASAVAHDGARYVICNADEGDPGAYMDRSLLEGNPHSVIEGMIIGAYAVGAGTGYVYVRHEYPLALKNLRTALIQAERYGLLGDNILGSRFNFRIRISVGGGAFVCGEETALLFSIEGKPGNPRQRPPFPARQGLFGKPTVLNNVETWANVPVITGLGGPWYARLGTRNSKGTKIFSLVGKINNTGLVEVPMGITLREIVFDIGGGIPGGKGFKAVQTGGPSGGCLPESLLDLPVDFDRLIEAGSIMGSGGMIVMDGETCMVDVARYFTHFLTEESCGKCVPCREGLDRMLDILTDITEGRGRPEDIELLQELGEAIKSASLCALGRTAPNPVLSTLRYFRDEYDAHIRGGRCPAGVCKALISCSIDTARCNGCGLCARECPQVAITGEKKQAHVIDQGQCTRCGLCKDLCKFDAVVIS